MSRTIPYPVCRPTHTQPIVANQFSAPTIRKCPHGQYLGEKDSGEKSPYCILCGGPGNPPDSVTVILPCKSSNPLGAGRTMANKRPSDSGCPECGSKIYLRKNERSDSSRECADCSHSYKVRLTVHQQAQEMKNENE